MRRLVACVAVGVTAVLTAGSVAGQSAPQQLVVYGDLTYFLGPRPHAPASTESA
jgi:hypothetical protein